MQHEMQHEIVQLNKMLVKIVIGLSFCRFSFLNKCVLVYFHYYHLSLIVLYAIGVKNTTFFKINTLLVLTRRFRRGNICAKGGECVRLSLRAARVNANLSAKKAAETIGVHYATILRWERGAAFPNVKQVQKIEEAYGIRYDDIIFLHNNTL